MKAYSYHFAMRSFLLQLEDNTAQKLYGSFFSSEINRIKKTKKQTINNNNNNRRQKTFCRLDGQSDIYINQ